MNLFKSMLKASIKSQLEYRFNFIVDSTISGIVIFSDFLMLAIVLMNFKEIAGWNIYEVAVLYSIVEAGWGIFRLFGEGINKFEELIISGKFDTLLTRPISPIKQLFLQKFELKRIGVFLQAILVGSWGLSNLNITSIYMYPILIFFSIVITFEINLILAAIAFWTIKNSDIIILAFYSTRTASSYPINIYGSILRSILTFFIPIATVGYYPVSYLLGKTKNSFALFSPVLGTLFLIPVTYFIWKMGLKKYTSTGS
ncbi:ABC transporter permease [Tepiditoga spiralis]|uniref:ABC transporter permease n=1 Tax=Tepiditoga spiralis TaxID=2108365 RepID=A0A7G1G5D8_9BACT|nr:ABC-2 family transporter protein [Tepiditoga spiralis]BBE30486.1 ABC transporter permease [Tepiditoga spiralis]